MTNWNRLYEEGLPDELPINVLPYANEEFLPAAPTRNELEIRRIALEACDEEARRRGVSRRKFLQTGAAAAITLAAINKVMGTSGGYYALASHSSNDPKACTEDDLHWPGAQLNNLPGEFIMDVQTHHVDVEDDQWRTQNPGQAAFFAAIWSQSACGEEDRLECLGRYHYLKEMFLDSSTNVTALSAVPYKPDGQPLPIERAAETCDMIKDMAGGTNRSVMHRFVMPNRGSAGHRSDSILGTLGAADPIFLQEELDLMEYTASTFNEHIRAWKVYTPWGDVPNTSGWWLDDPAGRKFIEHGLHLSNKYNMPALICTHKGFALPTFDQEKAATRDVGIVARTYPGMHFMVYHSGYDGDGIGLGGPLNQGTSTTGPYPLDVAPDGSFSRGAGIRSRGAVHRPRRGQLHQGPPRERMVSQALRARWHDRRAILPRRRRPDDPRQRAERVWRARLSLVQRPAKPPAG
jgi:uncharacterized protein